MWHANKIKNFSEIAAFLHVESSIDPAIE